jgi:deoxyribonuclease-4
MPYFGAHMSAAGGPHRALEAAAALGMQACQLFTKNNQQWRAAPLAPETIITFTQTHQRLGLQYALAHASYLLNLATKNDVLWEKSVAALTDELQRANQLQLASLVIHPGTASDEDEKWALLRIAAAIDAALAPLPKLKTKLLLETTAGQGKSIGHRFQQLGFILSHTRRGRKVGICLDTCHIFAAGYALSTAKAYRQTMKEFDQQIGLERLAVLHINDSLKPLASRVDRHAHIGHGHIGLEGFCNIVNDPRLQHLPMILETPKGPNPEGIEWDLCNIKQLKDLCRNKKPS